MSDLNLSQIQKRLNELFVTYGERKLIFWFDPKKEFEEEIDSEQIKLDDAKVYKLEEHCQFMAKRFFEIEDTKNNYLIYAPFEKIGNDDENNHLLSVLKYSEQFSADRISMVMNQLEISTDLRDVMEQYSKFFEAKVRISAFEKLAPSKINSKEELEMTILAVLTKSNTTQFYSIVQALIVEYARGSSEFYEQLTKFNLQEVFWNYIDRYYGYVSDKPTIQKLIIAFYVNAFYGQLGYQELPQSLKEYEVLDQTTAIVSFMDSMMNDSRYLTEFNKLSENVYLLIGGDRVIDKIPVEKLLVADIFEATHTKIIQYSIGQLLSGDKTPSINDRSLADIVKDRERLHFGEQYVHHYESISNAQRLLSSVTNIITDNFSIFVKEYEESIYLIDQYYRNFIWHLDSITDDRDFAKLQEVIENTYSQFLDESADQWNESLSLNERLSVLDFYDNFARSKTKTVVIISDALRYEAAKELQEKLQSQKKLLTDMKTVFSVIPSVTEFGKAASIRSGSETYEYIDGIDVRVNGLKTQGTKARDKILKEKNQNNLAIAYSDVVAKKNAKELREIFNGKELIYLYHDQIDKTGDHGQEAQVFDATKKAIDEIKALITFISNGANVSRFIVTSDHGFIYKRSSVKEYEKIENPSKLKSDRVERRFIISENRYTELGIESMSLGDTLKNNDERYIHFPKTAAIFKKAGGGQNYIHGGSSPQEMLIPVLEVNVARGSSQKEAVTVRLTRAPENHRITGLSVTLEFYQTEEISDSVDKMQYLLYFEDAQGNLITNQNSYYADSTSKQSSDRFTKFTFDFINRNYEQNEKVYLVMKDNETKIESNRIEFFIDNPFAGGFGFDI
ncbi:BREX-1 system phosphatase PglZ type A [Ligilactobacillus faecis]|uniref:BREX-1 system phosphatase PglZ type A n=1 Tax=Ligilactobacillus faecis TaxID=762833 RepID=UPI00246927D7|nr:BREX-1 system phosphatase PglZ type A [Ligilactobacillus faecis]WGN88970.1 BREX-1 system phosphatase PglZ type A [Ligilactobacillus faecis]